jgi:hypothetical protein
MTYRPGKLLSSNEKTGCSLNLPLDHCNPTPNCVKDCYARSGPMALPASKKKQLFVSNYLLGTDISMLIWECSILHAVRLNGSGDLLTGMIKNILKLAKSCPDTKFYGMTRKIEIATAINNKLPNLSLLVSVDSSSPDSVWDYPGKLCFGPRRITDIVPNDKRIVTVFPYHCHGSAIKGMPKHKKDCQAVWHKIPGCMACKRCWSWYK